LEIGADTLYIGIYAIDMVIQTFLSMVGDYGRFNEILGFSDYDLGNDDSSSKRRELTGTSESSDPYGGYYDSDSNSNSNGDAYYGNTVYETAPNDTSNSNETATVKALQPDISEDQYNEFMNHDRKKKAFILLQGIPEPGFTDPLG